MPFENDRYHGTTTNLDLRKQEENQPTEEMIDMITKAGKWARYISYGAMFGVISLASMFLIAIFLITQALQFALAIIPIGGLFFVAWRIYSITKQYANLARDLADSEDIIEDLAICFELHTSFIKLLTLFTILMFVLGLVAAIIAPMFNK